MQNKDTVRTNTLKTAILILLPFGLLTNLDIVAFYDDEAIRSLVAMEMGINNNYIAPTLLGEWYYNKPPLYNWILHIVFKLTGQNGEFVSRSVTVFFLLMYSLTIYLFFKKNFHLSATTSPKLFPVTKMIPLATALAFVTSGRILFWESMLGLIDMCFSWVVFLIFMAVFHFGEKKEYWRLFLSAYILSTVGYMLKGLPALVFLGTSLLTYFIWQKKVRLLFSVKHVAGIFVFFAVIGGYYFLYSQYNSVGKVLETVLHESAKRTFIGRGIKRTVLHFFSFPFEMFYHFLPWTLLVICAIKKDVFQLLKENKFLYWNCIVFMSTIVPYWVSVEVYPRYLLMHVPLVYSVLLYFYFRDMEEGGQRSFIVNRVFLFAICLSIPTTVLPLFLGDAPENALAKIIVIASCLTLLVVLFLKDKAHLLILVTVMLVARIGYNLFVLPSRAKIECSSEVRDSTIRAARIAGKAPIHVYKNFIGLHSLTGYYYTRTSGKILKAEFDTLKNGTYYLIEPKIFDGTIMEKCAEVRIKWKCEKLWLIRPTICE